ncbi:DDT domain-containing protein [Cavenderia fasciculata]|uniref:DDT domain-containing protein n=1 Tax=Cavenderia fasciculata TaxID=261658 RepID=F4QEG0_CACFS|nr:DDT domain-containing protein [Cavenderia fasciculata]EGG13273.1 DDT domain-containing protein [Cavenderia fasciculata]|eukprot:XP_004349972.1 DDT domain-containing protein [Cavenderia fasciculata]
MPLLGKQPYELNKTKPKVGGEYFVVRFTNEHFKTYSEYIEALERYRQRIWSCSLTGKANLTYEEALLSEKTALDKGSKFSDLLLPHCLRLIQYQEMNVDDLRDIISEYFSNNYFAGEHVTFKISETKKFTGKVLCRIKDPMITTATDSNGKTPSSSSSSTSSKDKTSKKSKLNSKNLSESESSDSDDSSSSRSSSSSSTSTSSSSSGSSNNNKKKEIKVYKILIDEKTGKTYDVPISDIIRRVPPINKQMIKDTIKLVAKRAKKGYWLVEESLIQKYGVSVPIPHHLRGDSELKRKAEEMENKKDDQEEEQEEVRKRKKSVYPMEDLEIERGVDTDGAVVTRPIASNNFVCSQNVFGDLLMVWFFLNRFEYVIHLSPFSLEDFESALSHPSDTTLLSETHMRLLRMIFSLPIYNQGTPKKTFSAKMLTERNWLPTLKAYFQYETRRLDIEEKRKQEKKKQIEIQNNQMIDLANDLQDDEMKDEKDEEKDDEKDGKGSQQDEDEDISMEDSSDEESESEDDSSEEDLQIVSTDPKLISKSLKKNNYYRLDIEEKIFILSYLCQQSIASDKIRKHIDENEETSNEIRQEKRELVAEERKIKREGEEEKEKEKEKEKKKKASSPPLPLNTEQLDKIQKKEENLEVKLDQYSSRYEALGKDRDYNKYWYWSQLPGRLFIETTNGDWSFYTSRQELEDLMQYLDHRGVRERKLINVIKAKYDNIANSMDSRTLQITNQLNYEQKRSARIKMIYGEKTFMTWENDYE